ncbi:MAG: sugar phosphate isomerase/epimerase family protein [Opitutaceae bacterium]|nr:sugar phosphate isomerase/epimerase family protein [Opitutaceae bacterium]
MTPPLLSRRRFVATLPAAMASLTLLRGSRLAAANPAPRVGCQANGFPLKPNDFPALLRALTTMKELGYTGFECNIRFVESEFERLAEARKRIEDTGVAFIGTHTSMQLAKPDTFPRWIEKVAGLGAACIVMSGAGLAADGNFSRDALLKKAASLNALGQTCRAGGLRLAYHNHNPEFARRNAEIEGLAEATNPDAVEFLLDAGHARLGGGDPAAFMRKFSRRILGCHLKTYSGAVQVPLGQGDWGFEDLATAIKSTNWAGWLITEEGGGPRTGNTAALGPDRAYIRKVFGV